jgi:hypothetical protein
VSFIEGALTLYSAAMGTLILWSGWLTRWQDWPLWFQRNLP